MNGDGPALDIGLYSPGWPPEKSANGIVTYVEAIAEGMCRLGHRPYILSGTSVESLSENSTAPVIDLQPLGRPTWPEKLFESLAFRMAPNSPRTRVMRTARGLRRAMGGRGGCPRPDVLEIEETLGLAGAVAARIPVPVVARLHGPWFLNGPNQGDDPSSPGFAARVQIEGEALRAVDGVTAPSADVLRRVRDHYGLALEKAEVIPNPVRIVPSDRRWRADGCEPDHVLFVGRFDRHKGGDTIVDAFALLQRSRPASRLTFVGPDRGLIHDGRPCSLPDYIEHRLPGALADGRVSWLGQRPPSEVAELRLRAAVTAVASRYETFAITITEAMAVGCPLVATRAGGAGELFEHGEHGLYVPPDDPGAMASAIAALLADPARAAAMGRAASVYCERHYAPEAIASQTIRFYRRVLSRADGRNTPGKARP